VTEPAPPAIPRQGYGALFLRFLRFGALAWGGPVAQIAMIRRELVDEERWISTERFHRALAVYQVLPGPEAHELCVYFGMLARGRVGGVLAGLGFMLPGFVLMLALSWWYVASGRALSPAWQPVFLALQAAVIALIVRAIHRIGAHALTEGWLLGIAALAFASQLAGLHFLASLALAGILYVTLGRGSRALAGAVAIAWIAAAAVALLAVAAEAPAEMSGSARAATLPSLFGSGLKSGLLSFGGAYTVIPFLQRDAVVAGAWMSNEQFLDGLALGGVIPAPLIIFSTFVGYLGAGPWGAVVITCGIFLPAFSFTLIAHDLLERVTQAPRVHRFLSGVTAGVVGMIAATAVPLARDALGTWQAAAVFAGSLVLLYVVKHRLSVLLVIGSAALAGKLLL
jgi:chromate transporter